VDPIELPEPQPLFIRYAENDNDVIAIHRFLLVVARPAMLAPVNVVKSLEEVIRVAKEEVALMAMRGDMLVGTLGLMRPTWWYGDESFLTDRWNFVVDPEKNGDAGKLLWEEARKIADVSKLPLINQGKIRRLKSGDYLMFPRLSIHEPSIYTPEGSA
jgi:hypothetical protein